jgi:hypothetical protein
MNSHEKLLERRAPFALIVLTIDETSGDEETSRLLL